MTAETSNARGEVVAERQAWYEQQIALAEGQWAAAFLDRWECGDDVPSKEHYVALWLAERAAPPAGDAEAKTVPVPTRVHLIGETAVIVGTPGRGWDEEGPEAHNCDAMGCATIGPHVLARVPFTDERAMSQPAEAQAQGGGEVAGWVLEDTFVNAKFWTADTPPQGWTPVYYTAPPSAPVGVEAIAAEIRASLVRGATVCTRRRWAIELEALAQQPAAGAVDKARFKRAPCYLCGYNGPGYYQPDTHPCAAKYHATKHQEPTTCKHDFRRDEDHGGACCQLCGEVRK